MDVPAHIRSFVRRQSRMTAAQAQALDNHFADYALVPGADLPFAFGNDHPIIVEIGYGSGESLLHQAKVQPHHNFIGIEIHRPGIGHVLHHIVSQSIPNIRLICQDAIEVLRLMPDNSLSGVQIFFPDPWQKYRHHKRRLIQASFLNLVYPLLRNQGFIHCATDWAHYGKQMLTVFTSDQRFEGGCMTRPAHRLITRFEERGLAQGHRVMEMLYRKKSCVSNSPSP